MLQYKRVHGHCIVPSNYEKNPQLAVWVKRQRRQYKFYTEKKPTSMTPERIAKLETLGFAWDCRKSKDSDHVTTTSPNRSVTPPSPQPPIVNKDITVVALEKTADPPALDATNPTTTKTNKIHKFPACEFISFSRNF